MSILPSQSQGSISPSSPSSSQIPNAQHGIRDHFSPSTPYISGHIGSLRASEPPSSVVPDHASAGKWDSAEYMESSGKLQVIESEITNGKNSVPNRSGDTRKAHGQGSEPLLPKEKVQEILISPQKQGIRSSMSHGSITFSARRKSQVTNGNHLLNFRYDPITRPQFRPLPPPRRQQNLKPFNRDLFLQANYKFVVLDTGNYAPESVDPDKMLQWEDIICVRYSTPSVVQCPICLEYPLCPQITCCGHIFCFPCILQYLLMGEEDHKGEHFKRCPLCFLMVSPKDLYTIYIENVKYYCIGDTIDFTLLTRQKDSFTLLKKNKLKTDSVGHSQDEVHDPFAKFTLTSDIELSVRKAISDLDDWLARAESGLVDDLERLPYVCAAVKELEQRKKCWNEQHLYGSKSCKDTDHHEGSQGLLATSSISTSDCVVIGSGHAVPQTDIDEPNKRLTNLRIKDMPAGGASLATGNVSEAFKANYPDSSSVYDESRCLLGNSNGIKDSDFYSFYQAVDGQYVILHPLNVKCLLYHYGGYDMLPHRFSGRILQMETVTQSEATRRRYRYLSHFSLTTTFQLCEVDLKETLPHGSLLPFMEDITKREKQRKQLAKKELREKIRTETAVVKARPSSSSAGQYSHDDFPTFSTDDFEALGSCTAMSSSPQDVGERKLFSSVTKLGFGAAHDSPSLKMDTTKVANTSASATGSSRGNGMMSFANIASKGKSVENVVAPKAETAKKGKKPSRVLLSTSGGRRY